MRTEKRAELLRLQKAFEREADQFHDLSLSIVYFTQEPPLSNRRFISPNHVIMLWQYYGSIASDADIERFTENLKASNIARAGIRGSQYSCMAAIEGDQVHHFMRMASRAGSVFSEKEAQKIRGQAFKDFRSNLKTDKKSAFVTNNNALAIWLNYVLHHLGNTHPILIPEVKIPLDPYAASLSAIDRLLVSPANSIRKKLKKKIESQKFRVALSFPGERRSYVERVASLLSQRLGGDSVFYDSFYTAQLARPNLDILLQNIYHRNSELVVVFLCDGYAIKEWCGLEWRAIRDLIKQRQDDKIMLLRFDEVSIPGLFGTDGYINIDSLSPEQTVEAIVARVTTP